MKNKTHILICLSILLVALFVLDAGVRKYDQGLQAINLSSKWLDESGRDIERLSDELDEMKALCSEWITEPVYSDSGNDMSNK